MLKVRQGTEMEVERMRELRTTCGAAYENGCMRQADSPMLFLFGTRF